MLDMDREEMQIVVWCLVRSNTEKLTLDLTKIPLKQLKGAGSNMAMIKGPDLSSCSQPNLSSQLNFPLYIYILVICKMSKTH